MEESQKILKKTGKLKNTVGLYEDIKNSYDDLSVLIEMGDEEGDLSLVEEISSSIDKMEQQIASLRLETLLTG